MWIRLIIFLLILVIVIVSIWYNNYRFYNKLKNTITTTRIRIESDDFYQYTDEELSRAISIYLSSSKSMIRNYGADVKGFIIWFKICNLKNYIK